MRIENAKAHLEEGMRFLRLQAWRGADLDSMEPVENFTIAEELDRVDRALGPPGRSMFATLAEDIRSAYTEMRAALQALGDQ